MPKQTVETAKFRLPPGLPFSKGIRKGHHVYISGTVSFNEEGEFVGEGDIYKQTQQVLQNVVAVVEGAGGTVEDIVIWRGKWPKIDCSGTLGFWAWVGWPSVWPSISASKVFESI